MNKKIISIFTSLAFIIFSISCYTSRTKEIRTEADWEGKKVKKVKILWVNKTSGEYIEFSKGNPGRIYEDKIVGTATIMSKKVEIDLTNIKKIRKHSDGSIFKVIDKDGKKYPVVGKAREEEDKFIFFTTYETFKSVFIPLSEVKSLRIKKFDPILTLLELEFWLDIWK